MASHVVGGGFRGRYQAPHRPPAAGLEGLSVPREGPGRNGPVFLREDPGERASAAQDLEPVGGSLPGPDPLAQPAASAGPDLTIFYQWRFGNKGIGPEGAEHFILDHTSLECIAELLTPKLPSFFTEADLDNLSRSSMSLNSSSLEARSGCMLAQLDKWIELIIELQVRIDCGRVPPPPKGGLLRKAVDDDGRLPCASA